MNARIMDWNDVQFALQVAKLGTLSAAAEIMDVHHSTVLRRIDALEKHLGTQLFHRHAKGYAPTEAGERLLKVAGRTQDDLDLMMAQIKGTDSSLGGKLTITTESRFSRVLIPIISRFQRQNPEIEIEFLPGTQLLKLEQGEAHVAVRPGPEPEMPDYVIQPLKKLTATLFASHDYVRHHGKMKTLQDIQGHRFIAGTSALQGPPFFKWLDEVVPRDQICFRASDAASIHRAVVAGIGVAPLTEWIGGNSPSLQSFFPALPEWDSNLWIVTHRDVHRTAKVQAFTRFLKASIRRK